jgi:hypothetical protein
MQHHLRIFRSLDVAHSKLHWERYFGDPCTHEKWSSVPVKTKQESKAKKIKRKVSMIEDFLGW